MKKLKFFLPFAALGLLASCSNDDLGNQPEPTPDVEIEGLYATFNLALPQAQGTKAENPSFGGYDEGSAAEYAINNIHLYLFQADVKTKPTATEADATYFNHYQLGLSEWKKDNTANNGITGVQKVTFQIDKLDAQTLTDNDYYALIIVNQPSTFTAPTTGKFEDWNKAASSQLNSTTRATKDVSGPNEMMPNIDGTTYFMMSNAPIYKKGSTPSIEYLVKLEEGNFATSPKRATEAAATVYVQRGVAKVTLTNTSNVSVEDQENHKFEVTGWALDITNNTAYPVQRVESTASFGESVAEGTADWSATHFLDALKKDDTSNFRIAWAIGTQYEANSSTGKGAATGFSSVIPLTDGIVWNGSSDSEYCFENTMNYNAMLKNQSTRVIVKGKYYLENEEGNGVSEAAEDFVVYPGSDLACSVKDLVVDATTLASLEKSDGKYKLSQLIKSEDGDANLKKVMSALQVSDKDALVYYYPEGITYYSAIIRHFNEEEAGLEKNKTYATIGDYTKAQLGRYGLVRNNSYQVKVTGVVGFGLPEPTPVPGPDPDDKPDPVKYNILMDVTVLDWSVRNGDYIFK